MHGGRSGARQFLGGAREVVGASLRGALGVEALQEILRKQAGETRRDSGCDIVLLRCEKAAEPIGIEIFGALLATERAHDDRSYETYHRLRRAVADAGETADRGHDVVEHVAADQR